MAESITNLPRLGPDLSIHIDALEKLEPDLVLSSLSVPGMEKNVEELERRNIPQIVLNPQSLHDIANHLLTVGKECGIETIAKTIAADYISFIQEMQNRASEVETTPSLYWEWWPETGIYTGQH